MRTAAVISVLLHVTIFVIAWIGVLPSKRPMIASAPAIEVEIVSDIVPTKPQETAKPTPKPAPPPPPPPRRAPAPPPEPKVAATPDPVAIPEPKIERPKKKPPPPPKPKAVEKPKPKPEKKVRKPLPRPKAKPKPPSKHDFASVLKTLEKLEKQPPPAKKVEKKKDVAPLQQVADLLKKKPAQPRLLRAQSGLSSSELDAIRQHIEPCWNLPAGARDAGSMAVEIRVTLNPDGGVRSAVIVDQARARGDGFYRSMAESALRAMLNPRCQPLPLPLEKYSEWRDMVIFFDPQEMF